jgi:glycosyltransferase involved in cell wall biosynthesis
MNGKFTLNTSPLVSIIINCYNGEEYLNEAIESVFAQTYSNWEIIFWDNCSTDKSSQIARSYGAKLKYFLAEKKTNLGDARNLALKNINGEYIAFIDCDDIWEPSKLFNQVEMLEENRDLALCYSGIEEILPDGSHFRYVNAKYKTGFIFRELLMQYDISILTSMIRASILNATNLSFDSNITASEEYCLFMQLACNYKIGVNNTILAKYRVHESSLTSKSLQILGKERRYTLNKIIFDNPQIKKTYKNELREAFARADYYDARWLMSHNDRIGAFKLLIKNSNINLKYFLLMILSLFPVFIWNKVHKKYRQRV